MNEDESLSSRLFSLGVGDERLLAALASVRSAACLILCLSLSMTFGCSDSSDRSVGNETNPIRVMSYNLRYGDNGLLVEAVTRADPIIASIEEYAPDFIGVQEANEPWMQLLPERLVGYQHIGVGRDDGMASGEFSAIFYREASWEVIDSGTFWLSDTPEVPSFGWGANHRRICTWGYFRHRITGEMIAHFNTHLDHESELARENGIALILDQLGRSPYPALLTGDLNFPEGTELYEVIQASSLSDTKALALDVSSHGTINFFLPNAGDLGLVIDFIFVQEAAFDVARYQVDTSRVFQGLPASDHYPVIADIALRP